MSEAPIERQLAARPRTDGLASAADADVHGAAGDHAAPAAARDRRDDICIHIFTASATLVGVCLTVIGVLRVVHRLHPVSTLADEFLSVDALAFLVACAVSYAALRSRALVRRRRLERLADVVFMGALALMVVVAAMVTWTLA